jgi:hypothetical protein
LKRLFIGFILLHTMNLALAENQDSGRANKNFELNGVALGMIKSEVAVGLKDCGLWYGKTSETYCRWVDGTTFGGYQVWFRENWRKDDILFDKNNRVIQIKFRLKKVLDDKIEQALINKFGPCMPDTSTWLSDSQSKGCRNGTWKDGFGGLLTYEVYEKGITVSLQYEDGYSPTEQPSRKVKSTASDI